ncbi:MAG: cytochrome c3 family protein [Acidobacteria bacterium]|nr:cytochrome c3 family protein [Acidobacteriota bacterium]
MIRAFTLCCVLILTLVGPAAAGTPPQAAPKPPTNDDCLACHGDAGAVRGDGRSVAVKPEVFGASIHGAGGVACIDCHADLAKAAEFPHPEKLAPAQCASCHDTAVAAYDTGVHAQARRTSGNLTAATCADCHGSHDIKPSADPDSRTHHLRLIETCGRCHGNEEIIKRGKIAIGNVVDLFRDSIHGKALIKSGLSVAPTCSDCHGNHDIRRKSDPTSRVFRKSIPDTCSKCHTGVGRLYWESVHGTQVAKGSPLAPVCTSCHTAHDIRRSDVEGWKLEVIKECGTCHEQSLNTYRDTFHGQVTALGYSRVASCADCHGSHHIFPKADARSTVAPANVVTTCKKCHFGATASFAKYDPHGDPENHARNPFLFYTSKFMKMLLFGVFAFFGIHTGLWFARGMQVKTAGRMRRRKGQDSGEDGE